MKRFAILLAAFASLGLAACSIGQVRKVRVFTASDLVSYDLKRVVVFPFFDEVHGDQADASASLTSAFIQELRKRTRYEVVELSRDTIPEVDPGNPARKGEYRTDGLIATGKRFHADAILFGTVTALRPYYPQALGLRAEMVSVETGATLWSVDALYDAADADVENAVKDFYEDSASHYSGTEEWRTILASPSRFAGFVASRCVDAISKRENARSAPNRP